MSCGNTIYVIEDLILVCKLSVISQVCHGVWMPHWVSCLVALQESEALGGLWREIFLDL